jgi:hypothetical protein
MKEVFVISRALDDRMAVRRKLSTESEIPFSSVLKLRCQENNADYCA